MSKKTATEKTEKEDLLSVLRDFIKNTGDDWNYITPEEFKKLQDKGKDKDFYILDIRRPEDFEKGHISGAHNIFWMDLLKPENIEKLPKDKKILVYCYVGHTSSQILVLLKLLGYDVISLKFGIGKSPVEGIPVAGWIDFGFGIKKEASFCSIFSMLDSVADSLESKGFIKEAHDLDIIANTMEFYEDEETYSSFLEKADPTLRDPDESDEEKYENKGLNGRGEM